MTILIIDDDPAIRRLAGAFLSERGANTVYEARSGEEGLVMAEQHQPDAILLDSLMPGMDGPSTLKALRARSATASIPVIFLTATTEADEVEQLARLGARKILAKPFNPVTLAATVREILSSPA